MEEDFEDALPAIWLVFGGTYLSHSNAPKDPDSSENREQLLVNLLRSFLESESVSSSPNYDALIRTHLASVCELLTLWSEDLNVIYNIRESQNNDAQVRKLARQFLKRVQNFEDCTIIPNGLISAGHTGEQYAENVSLGILTKKSDRINWIQVDPGSAYHQHCEHVAGEKCNAYLEILDFDPDNITEDWLYLLLGLKASHLHHEKASYKDVSLYEGLLSHLNGKTVLKSEADDEFIVSSPASPAHTWQVVDLSFRYLLRHFLGDSHHVVYQQLLTDFKLFLTEETLEFYQDDNADGELKKQCHFLLQEMSREVAQQALDEGNKDQKESCLELITRIQVAIAEHDSQREQLLRNEFQFGEPSVRSLKFNAPNLRDHSHSASAVLSPKLDVDPFLLKPGDQEDIIDYVKCFEYLFVNKLVNAQDINGVALLSHGLENFFIDYLAQTNILEKSTHVRFSKDDTYLAEALEMLAGVYYCCQTRLVKCFLSNSTYQPQFYAKNVTIQFFVYAAVTALNYRDRNIGQLLVNYNLCVDMSGSLTLNKIIPQLVLNDSRWVKVLLATQAFFKPKPDVAPLFLPQFNVVLKNDAYETDVQVAFAYQLLQYYPNKLLRFTNKYRDLEDEKFNRKWAALTYTEDYLPSLYFTLSKVANLAKAALTGFPASTNNNRITSGWSVAEKRKGRKPWYVFFQSNIKFEINNSTVSPQRSSELLTSYFIKPCDESGKDPHQRFITSKEQESKGGNVIHFVENEIIANQDEKPETMPASRYMQLGFLQSEPWVKLERLYIALKDKQLDFSCEQESILIQQTLFEISVLIIRESKYCSLLEWTVNSNAKLVHAIGLLCIEKAKAMQFRLSQHHAIGEILLVSLGLLTFYLAAYKDTFIKGIVDIYLLLKNVLANPPAYLSDSTLLHLNAYLIIAIQAKPQLLETETLTVLKALVAIQNYKVKGARLDNYWLLRVHEATFVCSLWIEYQLGKDPTLLNDLLRSVAPDWLSNCSWIKSADGLLYTCENYAIKPLLGCIYFENQSVVGLPEPITCHPVFKEYLGEANFPVRPAKNLTNNNRKIPCYVSVHQDPELRLTLIKGDLIIEKRVGANYLRFIPVQEVSGLGNCSCLIYELPNNQEALRHWLDHNNNILIKDEQGQVILKWNLGTNFLFSMSHEGFVVPWEQLEESFFKTCLAQVESPAWIELIAEPSADCAEIHIKSLNFPRLGLNFIYKQGQFFSKQIHGYVIAEQQYLNTLQGFYNYLILEQKAENTVRELVKIIIPHRKVYPRGPFYVNTVDVDRNEVRTPAYFVYDYDSKMGLLKGHHIRAHLYLALLYFRSASFDEDELSHCNAYHLARENLEQCWKDQPYDNIELSIIEQLLDVSAIHQRGLHTHLCALYLKVVSLLSSSLRLFMDETVPKNKKRSDWLLERCTRQAQHFLLVYLQNKAHIFARIRLTPEEEEDAIKFCSPKKENEDENDGPEEVDKGKMDSSPEQEDNAEEDYSMYFLPNAKKCYNSHYRQFFRKKELTSTDFEDYFQENISIFSFVYDAKDIDFSAGINGILVARFRLSHFITLYNLAKSQSVSIDKYRYLLHHLLVRAKVNYESIEAKLVMMLARILLLVAENPASFPDAPAWFIDSDLLVDLSRRQLCKTEVLQNFPSFTWLHSKDYYENIRRKEEAQADDLRENEEIFSLLSKYDLDNEGIPCSLPKNPNNFGLRYENYINFSNNRKRTIVREHYLQAAYNDAMYQFFVSVSEKCDELKFDSEMGWAVARYVHKDITINVEEEEKVVLPAAESVSLEKWAVPQQPLIDLINYFAPNPLPPENSEFLFESQLIEQNGYQKQFYRELKHSWLTYTNEIKCSYSWLHAQSVNELESVLRTKYTEFDSQAKEIWGQIMAEFEQRSNNELNDYFALRWFSGQVRHYHKRDILRLLIEPHKISSYNPDCVERSDDIIQALLDYTTHEINSAKIVRVLALIQLYNQAKKKPERFSILQNLVRSLQENIDPASYRYPHWFLFQLENGIIVRDNQRELIDAMLNQTEKAMYQLNMGEGKSSVILPLLSYNLADGQQLLRINVLSALLTTMKEFLRQRFSGLIQKHVYTLPFSRDTDISIEHLQSIFKTLQTCQDSQHILLTTPEHRLCLQLKIRELTLENQQQIGATNIFNWKTYRQRAYAKMEVYLDLNDTERESLLLKQDQCLKTCLHNEKYIDSNNKILKVPPRGQGRTEFARFKETINDSKFREWSCLKAAYRELLYNSTIAYKDCSEKLALLNEIGAITAIDLLDESDEILKHGTELNYTVGDRHVFAGGEFRWLLPQNFIRSIFCDSVIRKIINEGVADGFTSINLHFSSHGGVPFVQLLDESYYENRIKPLLINNFFEDNLPSLRKYNCNADNPLVEGECSSLRDYIAGKLESDVEKEVIKVLADKGSLKDKVLIAKGWLSHGILFHVFNAKYRVQYGLNLNSTKQIAIPFFGKDAPSPRSEFSHPDVMLGFTIISYMYQGLSQKQLKETLNKLKNKFSLPVADAILSAWTDAGRSWIQPLTDIFPPLLLKSLQFLDLEEEQCLVQVHKYLAGNYEAIFFYLNQYVLLEEAMQYIYKISANAHSLVGYNGALGFSGTDDRKITMPFQIKSLCSTTQEGTNGKLLSVLTQERNSHYYSLETDDTIDLLKELSKYVIKQPNCHALIDAGALVTGLTNQAVGEFFLANLPSRFLGILYFSDESNSLTVLTRDKKTVTLQDCYLDKQYLFAYLDDIHTRGTDIQLPLSCHAILTVGLGMEKDKLMQAAMRLRQLAQKQSVSLWGTQAVTLAIKRDNKLKDQASINSREVIKWVTQNTINHINADLFPVAVRKINFQCMRQAEALLREAPTKMNSLIQYCQEKELFQLDEFYAASPQIEDLADRLDWFVSSRLRMFGLNIEQELRSKQLTGTAFYEKVRSQPQKISFKVLLRTIREELSPYLPSDGFVRNSLDNDEEKEVEVEIIKEQEVVSKVEKRPEFSEKAWNVTLILRQDFIRLAEEQGIIMPLRRIKDFVQVPSNLKNIVWHSDIYMTANFIHTVKSAPNEILDNYLRPVDLVLIHRSANKSMAILLSGQEASQIKLTCYQQLIFHLLVHINDINGPTQLPVCSYVSKYEQKLLTIIKLFAGECHFTPLKEVHRVAKRVGRLYPSYFTCLGVTDGFSKMVFNTLVTEGFLDFSGVMTEKLFMILRRVQSEEFLSLNLPKEYQKYNQTLLKKLYGIFSKLIITSNSLKSNHETLCEWVGTRGRLKEYPGSELESVLNSEYEPQCSQ